MTRSLSGGLIRRTTTTLAVLALAMSAAPAAAAPPVGGDGPPIDEAVERLRQVEVRTFALDRDRIQPFGRAELRWDVRGPAAPWQLELNGDPVPATGRRAVAPRSTQRYTLVAVALGARRVLASVTLTVDTSRCRTSSLDVERLRTIMKSRLDNHVEATDRWYFRTGEKSRVEFGPGVVRFQVRLGERRDGSDPMVDVDGWFAPEAGGSSYGVVSPRRHMDVRVLFHLPLGWDFELAAEIEAAIRPHLDHGMHLMTDAFRTVLAPSASWGYHDLAVTSTSVRATFCPTS